MLQALNYGLDDVEASAIKGASDEIGLLDRMLTLLEARRNKALACIAEYRTSLEIRSRFDHQSPNSQFAPMT
jgi:hypothetical protein